MEELTPPIERILGGLAEKLGSAARVDAVFGEPREIAGRVVIPAAKASAGFGAGAGSGGDVRDDTRSGGGGGGGGGGFRVEPVAVVELSAESVAVQPVIDWTRVILALITTVGTLLGIRAWRRRRL